MNKEPTPDKKIIPMEHLLESREFQIFQGNNVFLILIGKTINSVKVKSSHYSVELNFKEISTISESPLNSNDDLFKFLVNIFMNNNVQIMIKNNEMNLKFEFFNNYIKQNKKFVIALKYSNDNINYFIYDLWLKLTNLEKENNSLKLSLSQEISNLKEELQTLKNNNVFTFGNCINNPMNKNNPMIPPINNANNNISLFLKEQSEGNKIKTLHKCNLDNTISEIIDKYREKINNKNLKIYLTYNANILNPKKTLKQVGITSGATLTVMKGDPPIN